MVTIGSARIDENGNISGGKAGDSTGKEVCTENYYLHKKGWYLLRPKSKDLATALATAMLQACRNDNIGYNQAKRTAVITALKKYGSLAGIGEKTDCDCSALVRACLLQCGVETANFTTYNEVKILTATGKFEPAVKVDKKTKFAKGDILVTCTKGHTAIVTESTDETTNKPNKSVIATKKPTKRFIGLQGKYKVNTNAFIRNGASTLHKPLTVLSKSTTVTCWGYYDESNKKRWLYVEVIYMNTLYVGFMSEKVLTRI